MSVSLESPRGDPSRLALGFGENQILRPRFGVDPDLMVSSEVPPMHDAGPYADWSLSDRLQMLAFEAELAWSLRPTSASWSATVLCSTIDPSAQQFAQIRQLAFAL